MIATFGRVKHTVLLGGLAFALVMTGVAAPLGHEAEAKQHASPRKVQSFANTQQRVGFIEGGVPVSSEIEVSGVTGSVTDIDLRLISISYGPDHSHDMEVLLVGPDGQSTLILSDVGGNTTTIGVDLAFDDQAPQQLPANAPLTEGFYQPTNIGSPDPWPGTIQPPSEASLAVFNGSDPNGTWTLFAYDDEINGSPQAGSGINGGWTLTITTANGPIARADSFKTKAGKTLRVPPTGVLANDSDPDDDALTATLADPPKKGKVEFEADGSFTYKAKKKAKGKDSFTYLAQDPGGLNAAATVDIQIKGKKHKKGKKH